MGLFHAHRLHAFIISCGIHACLSCFKPTHATATLAAFKKKPKAGGFKWMALRDVHHPKHWMRNAPIISTHGARSWQTNGWLWNCLPPLYCTWWCHHATLRRQKACHCFPWFMQWIPIKDDPIIDETTVLEGPIFHCSTSMIFGERVNHPFGARLHIPQELLPIFHCPGLASRCQPSLFKRAMERLSILYPHCSNASGNMNWYELWIPDRLALFLHFRDGMGWPNEKAQD